MMNEDFTRTMVRERHRDLARIASSTSTSRLARHFRRVLRKRNPDRAEITQPTAS